MVGDEEDPALRERNFVRGKPREVGRQRMSSRDLAFADEECEATLRCDSIYGRWQDDVEALDGPEGDQVRVSRKLFGAVSGYIDVRQCKGADDLAEERYLFVL